MSDTRITSPTFADVTRDVARTLEPPGNLYFSWMSVVALILTAGILAWAGQVWWGMGMAGKRVPQMWAMYITSFVFWIGIGHAGTLISAILYLFRARWRTSIYRAAEAMTIFAVMTAGLFPLIHAGRMWFAYFLLPYPNQRYLWPNFRSPLVWDVFAISTYLHQHGLLHRGPGARRGGPARCLDRLAAARVRDAVARLGGVRRPVAALPPRLRTPGRAGHAARALRSQRGVVGLRHGAGSRLALDAVCTVLRRRRDLLRVRDGADSHPAHAAFLQTPRLHPGEAPRRHGQADPDHRAGADVFLRLRGLHVVVQR